MPLVSSLHGPFMSVLTETDSPQNSACLGAPSPIAVSNFYFSLLYYLVFLFWVTGMELRPFYVLNTCFTAWLAQPFSFLTLTTY